MVDLTPLSPCAGLLPVDVGGTRIEEADAAVVFAILPYRGKVDAVARGLAQALGLGLPTANSFVAQGDLACHWFGLDSYLLVGARPPEGMQAQAALVDQSDAWAGVTLSGSRVPDVLARLVPVDLSDAAFPVGGAVRTLVGHMNAAVSRPAPQVWQVMVFRSMARTLVHELETAARQVAARPKG